MHVAMDGSIYEFQAQGGISRTYNMILPLMCEREPQLTISLYYARKPKQPLPTHKNIRKKSILPLDFRGLAWTGLSLYQRRSIALNLRAFPNKQTIWHSIYYSQPPLWRGPKIVSVYDLIYFRYPELFSRPADASYRQQISRTTQAADIILCNSATTANDAINYLNLEPTKVKFAHLAASEVFRPLDKDKQMASELATLPTQRPFLLYVGTRAQYKNFQFLLKAYGQWPRNHEVDLVVVSSAWSQTDLEVMNSYQITERVHLCQEISDEGLNILYNYALAFVYPSLYEGFGIPLLEAMTVGCPILASDIPSSREVAHNYPAYFDPTSIDALITTFDTLLSNPPSAEHNHNGKQIAATYSWQKTAHQTLQHYYALSNISPSKLTSQP